MCGGVSPPVVMCGSSISIHQGELRLNSTEGSFAGRESRHETFPPPTTWSNHAGDKSGVRAEPSLIQHSQTLRTRTEGRSGVLRPQGVSFTVQKARTHSNTCLLPCLCADPLICSSMLIPCYMDTQKEDKEKV